MDDLESRVTDLEIEVSYLTKMLDELNSAIIFQQKSVQKIEKINKSIFQKLQTSFENRNDLFSLSLEQKPPQY